MWESITGFLMTKVGAITAAGALLLAAKLGPALVRRWVKAQTAKAIAKALESDDPEVRAHLRILVYEAVWLAEHAIPGRGQGATRKAYLTQSLGRFVPPEYAGLLSDLIEEGVVTLDEELQAKKDELKPGG